MRCFHFSNSRPIRALRGAAGRVELSDDGVAERSGRGGGVGTAKLAMEIFMGITAADGYKTIAADLGKDPVVSPDTLRGATHGDQMGLNDLPGIGCFVPPPGPVVVW